LTKYLHCAVPARAPERIRTCYARRRSFLGAARDAIQFRAGRPRTQLLMGKLSSAIRLAIPARFRPIGFLTKLVEQRTGRRVRAGPFVGMNYVNRSCGSAYLPKLLGTYERELHWCVENICSMKPGLILNVGAAEGYYAIGLARRNPQARVIGFEMEIHGQQALREMTELNDVADRVEVRGQCEPADLAAALGEQPRPVVVCDVEGYEAKLLDPAAVPGLQRAAILVELHDFLVPGVTDQLQMRFATTHRVTHVLQESRTRAEFPWRTLGTSLLPKSYLDWAVSEWRPVQMRWLWMTPTGS
jgi:predicted O-methyltransferase YrrM